MRRFDSWKVRCAFACASLVVATCGARAGTVVSFETVAGACRGDLLSAKIDGGRFRVDSHTGDQEGTLLYDHAERMMTSLVHRQRQFVQIEVDEDALDYQGDVADSTGNYMNRQMEKVEAQMAQQCEQMRKQGMGCPTMGLDMRGMMKGMMANQMPTWRDTGRDGDSNGVACRWWEQAQGGRPVREECSARVSTLPIDERDRRGFERGMQVLHRYGSNMMGMLKGFTGQTELPSVMPKDALSIVLVCIGPDGKESGRSVARFTQQQIAESEFELPFGYTPMKMQ